MRIKIEVTDVDENGNTYFIYTNEDNFPKEAKLDAPVMSILNPIQLFLDDEAWKIVRTINKWSCNKNSK